MMQLKLGRKIINFKFQESFALMSAISSTEGLALALLIATWASACLLPGY